MAEFDPPPPELEVVEDNFASTPRPSLATAPKEPSLVFGSSGKFLSKYDAGGAAGPGGENSRSRKRDQRNISMSNIVPDQMSAQLTELLATARSTHRVLQVVETYFDYLSAANLIIALYRIAIVAVASKRVGLRRDGRFKRIMVRLSDTLRTNSPGVLKPRDLSTVVWALGKLGRLDAALCSRLSQHIVHASSSFEPARLSIIAWSYARASCRDEKLFCAVAAEVEKRLLEFLPTDIASITWAMAKLDFAEEEFLNMVAKHALGRLTQFKPTACSMLLYAFTIAKVHHQELFDNIAEHCTIEALSASPEARVLTTLTRTMSPLNVDREKVFSAVAHVASEALDDFRSHHIAALAQDFARAGVKHDKLFESISEAVVNRLADFKQQDLEDVLAAFEALGVSTTEIARAVASQQWQEQPSMSPRLRFLLIVIAVFLISLILCPSFAALRREVGGNSSLVEL